MELLVDVLLELLIDGSIQLVPDRRVPLWLRLVLAAVLLIVVLALILLGILLLRIPMWLSRLCGAGLLLLDGLFLLHLIRRIRNGG